jgi:hypothetical protein
MLKESIIFSLFVLWQNPIEWINKNYQDYFGDGFKLCFIHNECSISDFATLIGGALPLSLISFLVVYYFYEKNDKMASFIILLLSFSTAHALHA